MAWRDRLFTRCRESQSRVFLITNLRQKRVPFLFLVIYENGSLHIINCKLRVPSVSFCLTFTGYLELLHVFSVVL